MKYAIQIEIKEEKVYLKWSWKNIFHIVRDIKEARLYSNTQAKKLKKRFAHKNAKLILVRRNYERKRI